ncbi:hypothetical protein ACFVIY_17880 [Streptomyces sp. NPDC127166]|uniref:hypothetical protein n=1 Tax=Streptomyces sp. NPDC127166 TaxID=3345380 RepID=UPI003625F7A4
MPELPEAVEWWDQVSAWGTLGAVVVALFVAVNEGRRRRLDQADAEAAQARMVTVHRESLGVRIVNHSTHPLLGLTVTEIVVKEADGRRLVPAINNGGPPTFDVMGPGAGVPLTLSHFKPEDEDQVDARKQLLATDHVCCTYQFTDAQGLRWKRKDLEQPERLRERVSLLGRLAVWRR